MVDTRIPRQRWSAEKLNMTLMARIEKVWAETKPWTKNFTLYTQRWTGPADYDPAIDGRHHSGKQVFRPYWECNDPTGKCKGNRRWAAVFPAGRTTRGKFCTGRGFFVEDEENFVWDETCGPQMNGETLHECPYCN